MTRGPSSRFLGEEKGDSAASDRVERGRFAAQVRDRFHIRGTAKLAAKKKRAAAKVTTSTPTSTNGVRSSVDSTAENLLKAIGAELGLSRAMEVLSEEWARVKALIGG